MLSFVSMSCMYINNFSDSYLTCFHFYFYFWFLIMKVYGYNLVSVLIS
jgi:hypothetical protein